MNKKFPLSAAKLAINAGLVSLCLTTTAFAGDDHSHDKPAHDKPAKKAAPVAKATALVDDEKKSHSSPIGGPREKNHRSRFNP
ncbi:MAG: hypothetical protein MJK04_03645 [Psychrosphaera sp.]|nr:hypothetical protein [Psychrosphaera sp.]